MLAERPLRADARRNRERVLAAAEELFAEHGASVQMADVARRAGVGVAIDVGQNAVGHVVRQQREPNDFAINGKVAGVMKRG